MNNTGKATWALMVIATLLMALPGCENRASGYAATDLQTGGQNFQSQKINGQWTLDNNTATELRAMQNTMINFNLMIKKQPQNLGAYQAYGNLLKNHVDRTVTYCSLDKNAKSILCKDLDKIRQQTELIQTGDINQARAASQNINAIFTGIDSLFNFDY